MKIFNIIKNFFIKLYNKLFKTDFLNPESIVNYMFSAETLPEPLSIEEESSLVLSFQNNSVFLDFLKIWIGAEEPSPGSERYIEKYKFE